MTASEQVPRVREAHSGPETWLACLGDTTDPQTWSSIPYHLLDEGRRQGLLSGGLRLDPHVPAYRRGRTLWNLRHVLAGHRPGGYQYSEGFLERLWASELNRLPAAAAVINQFQLYPRANSRIAALQRWFYLDATIRLLVEHYGIRLDARWLRDILSREAEGYHAAAGVLTFSTFAADSVIRDYGVDPVRVHVVVPGANITPQEFQAHERSASRWRDPATGRPFDTRPDRPLRLVFVGRDVRRKGLDRLIRALAIARQRGVHVTLRVIGAAANAVTSDLASVDGVEWLGLVSRRRESARLWRLISECDLGCLPSRNEFSAIALREYLAMGLPTLGPRTGGCLDLMPEDATWAVGPEETDEALADWLTRISRDRDEFERKRRRAWTTRGDKLWAPSVRRISELVLARPAKAA